VPDCVARLLATVKRRQQPCRQCRSAKIDACAVSRVPRAPLNPHARRERLLRRAQEHTGKQPFFVHLEGEPALRMAGLFDAWKGEDGELLYTYTILTTDSSPRLQW